MVAFWIRVGVAGATAGVDWVAVDRSDRRLEYAANPAVVRPVPRRSLWVHVTYHVTQVLPVLSLLR